MKKILVLLTSAVILLGCGCSFKPSQTQDPSAGQSASDTGAGQIHFDYPDQLVNTDGGSASMTIYKCGACFYACDDGQQVWSALYSAPLEMDEGEFIHVDAEYELVYGGVAGYMGSKHVKKVSNEKELTLNEVADLRIIPLYDKDESTFAGLRLIIKDGKNYLMCRDPLLKYRLYDDNANLLCTGDASMTCAAYLEDGSDKTIDYGSSSQLPFYVMKIDGIYYAYSPYDGFNNWTPLLNMDLENTPVGFDLDDGETIKIGGSRVYKVNGGKENYVNAPMFEQTERLTEINYSVLNSEASAGHWEECPPYENGDLYRYMYSSEEYLIFRLDDRFYVFFEKNCNTDTDEFLGIFDKPEDVDAAIGRT